MIDIFGPWVQYDEQRLEAAACAKMPSNKVYPADVLLMNVELDDDSQIPFEVFDALNREHDIDVTGLLFSLTPRGNLIELGSCVRHRARS